MITKVMSFDILSLICCLIIVIKLTLDLNRVQAIALGQTVSANKDKQLNKNNTNNFSPIKDPKNTKILRALMINMIAQSTTFLIT
uniref:Uncharacterized protein n=1 Tax=Romanomermis culicivorax TaxID=13658 RepID=A0A915HT95_ROMCU